MVQPLVSVIVPVYNNEACVRRCMDSILNQTLPHENYEVIMVDNGSRDRTEQIIAEYPVSFVKEDQIRGPAAARNKGIQAARGSILTFVDADMFVHPDWLEKGIQAITERSFDVLVGTVLPPDEDAMNLMALYDKSTAFRHNLKTGNLFVRREVFEQVGYFDHQLLSAEDVDWGKRVEKAGYTIHYVFEVIAYHPLRNTFSDLAKKQLRVGFGSGQHILKTKKKPRLVLVGFELIKEPFRYLRWVATVMGMLGKATKARNLTRMELWLLIPVVLVFGALTGVGRFKAIFTMN